MTDDGPDDDIFLVDDSGDGPDLRLVRGDAETLTCLALATLWDDPDFNNFDYPLNRRNKHERTLEI